MSITDDTGVMVDIRDVLDRPRHERTRAFLSKVPS